jgi:hypothetical protein
MSEMLLSADVFWAIAMTPVTLVVLVLLACVLSNRSSRSPHQHDLADTAFWTAVKLDQASRGAVLGTPEPLEPVAETISLYTATLSEVQTYLIKAREARRLERREFGALMRMARTA